jgi:hypothetical protein
MMAVIAKFYKHNLHIRNCGEFEIDLVEISFYDRKFLVLVVV